MHLRTSRKGRYAPEHVVIISDYFLCILTGKSHLVDLLNKLLLLYYYLYMLLVYNITVSASTIL